MLKETMDKFERLEAAIRLEPVERVPVSIMSSEPFAYVSQGKPAADAYRDFQEDPYRVTRVMMDMWHDLGLDFLHRCASGANQPRALEPCLPHMRPGPELPHDVDQEVLELEVMFADEYDKLLEVGWDAFWLEHINRVSKWIDEGKVQGCLASYERVRKHPDYKKTGITMELIEKVEAERLQESVDYNELFTREGIPSLVQDLMIEPVAAVYFMRTIPGFMDDLHYRYDKVKAVSQEILIPWFLELIAEQCSRPLTKRIHLGAGWFTVPMVSKKAFEELQWSWLRQAGEAIIKAGRTPVFHLDSNWSETLHYFKDLPKGKFVVQLDGMTNIFEAKKLLRGHACLTGDVSAAMLCMSSPYEIESYCRELIDVVGKDSGFILYSGCLVPALAKIENVRAMVHTAKTYRGR